MTSTPFNVGLNDTARLSSRVLRPPGGGHTDIFGGEPEPAPRGRRLVPQPGAGSTYHQDVMKPTNGGPEVQNGQAGASPETKSPVTAEAKTPVTAEAKSAPAPAAEPARAEPPKRVRVPPGGFSSGLW